MAIERVTAHGRRLDRSRSQILFGFRNKPYNIGWHLAHPAYPDTVRFFKGRTRDAADRSFVSVAPSNSRSITWIAEYVPRIKQPHLAKADTGRSSKAIERCSCRTSITHLPGEQRCHASTTRKDVPAVPLSKSTQRKQRDTTEEFNEPKCLRL